MEKTCKRWWSFGWLEASLLFSLVALIMQLFPSVWVAVLWAIDIRNWPRTRFFVLNAVVVVTLILVRFGPDLYEDWRERHIHRRKDRELQQKKLDMREQRKSLERQIEARKRRLY
jgi:uncharacterized protein YlxW (UPF0749 family)